MVKMDGGYGVIERYRDTYQYHAESSVQQLTFSVTVWSQTNVGESEPRKLVDKRIHWGQKIVSPKEGARILNQELALQRSAGADGRPRSLTSEGTGEEREFLATVAALPGETLAKRFFAFCEAPGLLFTRPPREGFVDPELRLPTADPPMEATPLALLEAQREVAEHGPSMNIMMAVGYPQEDLATGSLSFVGGEVVLCSMFPIAGDGRFSARPSLEATHTAFVDLKTILTFRVELVAPKDEDGAGLALAAVGSSIDLKRLRAVAAAAASDEGNMKQRRVLLRQAVGTGDATRVEHANHFTPLPLHKLARLHIFGTIERATGILDDTLFLKCTWMLPDNWTPDQVTNDELAAAHDEQIESQLSYASLVRDVGGELVTSHTFNVPFNAHLIGRPFGGAVRLAVELFSLGSNADQFQSACGYGQITLPAIPGNYCAAEVLLWAPKPTASETLKSIFVGGAPSLANVADAVLRWRRGSTSSGTNSRAGLHSVPTGKLHVRFHVAMQAGPESQTSE